MESWDDVNTVKTRLGFGSEVNVESVSFSGLKDNTGMSGEMSVLKVVFAASEDGAPSKEVTYMVKRTQKGHEGNAKAFGLAREVFYYKEIQSTLEQVLLSHHQLSASTPSEGPRSFGPHSPFGYVDEESGSKAIVMEAIEGVVSGFFFGPENIHNHGKDLAQLTKAFDQVGITEADITTEAFELAGFLHGRFYMDDDMISGSKFDSLRARDWVKGKDEASWQASLKNVGNCWTVAKQKISSGELKLQLDEKFVALMDTSFSRIDFAQYVEQRTAAGYTLVHGDFHPGNFLVTRKNDSQGRGAPGSKTGLVLLDWEVVGVGSGPQDLGQFLISHSVPERRRSYEDAALRAYETSLTETMKQYQPAKVVPSFELILKECVCGGFERWVWLFALCTQFCPAPMLQYFHDQCLAFALDHSDILNVDTISMPRP